jgi:hypothetical protein
MSLADGDYIEVRDHIVTALNADTGSGGLREESDPPVKLIEAELRNEPRLYLDHEIPSIAVTILGKDERVTSGASVQLWRIGLFVYCRGLDSEAEIERAMRIAARVDKVLRAENGPDLQLGDLPASIEGALGALIVGPRRAEFLMGDEARRGQPRYSVVAALEAEIELPCSIY